MISQNLSIQLSLILQLDMVSQHQITTTGSPVHAIHRPLSPEKLTIAKTDWLKWKVCAYFESQTPNYNINIHRV